MKRILLFFVGCGGALTLLFSPNAHALCSLCRRALAQGGNEGLVQGFFWSIILIAGMPLLMLLTGGLFYYRLMKKMRETSEVRNE